MRTVTIATLLVLAAMTCGCSNPPSMNKRVALTDGAVSVAVAVALDKVSVEKYEAAKVQVVEVCTALRAFLKTGSIADLPKDRVETEMLRLLAARPGWAQYSSVVRSLFDYVDIISVNTGRLGVNNLILLDIGLQEAIDAARRSRMEWRATRKSQGARRDPELSTASP